MALKCTILHLFYVEQSRYGEAMSDSTWLGLLTMSVSSIVIGAFVGGTTTKFLLNFVSSKRLNQIAHVINLIAIVVSSLIGGVTQSYEAFIAGRLIAGIPCGITFNLAPMLVAELSARRKRGFWESTIGVSISFGFLIAAILAHPKVLGSLTLWPVLIGLGVLPSFIYLIASINIPETPYYLLRHGRKEEALDVLTELRKNEDESVAKQEVEEIENEIGDSGKVYGIVKILKNKQYRNQLIAVFALYANLMLCGVNNILFYSDLIFKEAGISADNVTFATIGVFALQFVMALIGAKFVDRFGGLKVTIAGSIGFIVSLTLFTVSQAMVYKQNSAVLSPLHTTADEQLLTNGSAFASVTHSTFTAETTSLIASAQDGANPWSFVSVLAIGIFMVAWSGGTHISTFALLGELTIEPTRATCFSYGNAVMWTTSWIVSFVPPYLQEALGPYSMVIWLGFTVFFLVYMVICIPDTKGRTTKQIQAKFGGKTDSSASFGIVLTEVESLNV
ncbi:solute carrier family 2, facilitated glucose transporter member 5-like isoform X2 [Clavelina lepadiformis]|uniref:solute carrier family 2, facilitated glucose transporter member 5-like isoform X2 n=1 Tax=Clavelina lepadiformis TaxID=159417 RepID=UPI0040418AAC